MSDVPSNETTRHALAKQAGRLAHELRNILTVLFGVADELNLDNAEVATRNAAAVQTSVDKAEVVANELFALRQALLAGAHTTADVAAGSAASAGLDELAKVFSRSRRLLCDPAMLDRLLMVIGSVAGRCNGLTTATDEPTAAGHLDLALSFASPPSADDRSRMQRATADAGGEMSGVDLELHCRLPIADS